MAGHNPAVITATGNRRVVEARKLRQRKQREEQGRFLVEGLQALHMALDAGARPLQAFYCEQLFAGDEAPRLLARCRAAEADLLHVSPEVMAGLSDREQPQGLVATFALFEAKLADLVVRDPALLVVIDRLQDPGNLGTLIRTADAIAAQAVILIEPCVDPFDPKVVRSTMGSLFNVPVVQTADVNGLAAWLDLHEVRLVGADVHQGMLWGEGAWTNRTALALGNEARGLSGDVVAHVESWVRLPMIGRAESLNVAVAGGVLMYLWARASQATAINHQDTKDTG
jgi:TrmH family RNA methyltransferase